MKTKRCRKCLLKKPLDADHYYVTLAQSWWRWCRDCSTDIPDKLVPEAQGLGFGVDDAAAWRQVQARDYAMERARTRVDVWSQPCGAGLKRCRACGICKPATVDYFAAHGQGADGLQPRCKTCRNRDAREKRAARMTS